MRIVNNINKSLFKEEKKEVREKGAKTGKEEGREEKGKEIEKGRGRKSTLIQSCVTLVGRSRSTSVCLYGQATIVTLLAEEGIASSRHSITFWGIYFWVVFPCTRLK